MAVAISWQQALAWRMRRHLLDPVGRLPVADVVGRLCGVQTQVASSAELAIRVRRETSRHGEVDRALRDGRLIKTWAMRGTLHLLTPEEAGTFLSLMAAGRSWERPSWQRHFGVTPKQLDALRQAVRVALEGGPLTRDELVTAIVARRGLRHAGEALRSGWGTLLKPLAWQGDLCFGPSRGSRVTFMRPEDASSRWRDLTDPDEAAAAAIVAYFRSYGPATIDAFDNWLAGGWFGKRQLRTWFSALEQRLVQVDVDGERAHVLAEDLDELAAMTPTTAVRLLPGFRPVRAGSRHRRWPRHTHVATCRGQQAERLDLAGRGGRWRRVRHLGAGWRPGARGVVQENRETTTERSASGAHTALVDPRSWPPASDQHRVEKSSVPRSRAVVNAVARRRTLRRPWRSGALRPRR
jgi:hypothetical protein